MKLSYYHSALIIAGAGIFFAGVPHYVYSLGYESLEEPKYWVGFLGVLFLPLLLKQRNVWDALKSPLILWLLGYVLLSALWFLVSSQSARPWQELKNRVLAVIEILLFLLLFWHPNAVKLARRTLVAVVLLGVAFNVYELFVPMSFSQVLGRSAGLYRNPNFAGEALVLGMLLSVTVLKSQYRTPYVLLVGIGVFLTISRGGIMAWVFSVAGLLFMRGISSKDFVRSGVIAFVLVILFILPRWDALLTTWEQTGVLNGNVMHRLTWLTDPSGVQDASSWERKYVANQAWEKIADHPILGSGTGESYQAYTAPHNQYLALMIDHGLFGILIMPLLVLAVTYGARGQSGHIAILFGFTIMFLGLFSHTMLYTNHSFVLLALMAAIAASSRVGEIEGVPFVTSREPKEEEAVQATA
jgi:O-antigen ligase